MTISGLLAALFILFFVAILGFKLWNPYKDYFTLVKIFRAVAANPELREASPKEIKERV